MSFICGPRTYKYKSWYFEVHACLGPWPLKQDGEPRKRAGNVFWNLFSEFDRLSDKEKQSYRTGGGCIQF